MSEEKTNSFKFLDDTGFEYFTDQMVSIMVTMSDELNNNMNEKVGISSWDDLKDKPFYETDNTEHYIIDSNNWEGIG